MSDLPKGWTSVKICDILTPEQAEGCVKILKKKIPFTEKATMLKEYLNQFGPQLLEKGCFPDYLAYAILAAAGA